MIKVVSFKICPFVQRVTALLEAKGLDYQVEYISLRDKPDWFLNISLLDTNLRDLFQIHNINMSIDIWVGFLALFGIATDDGVVMATYLTQQFKDNDFQSIAEIRENVMSAANRRVRPCLMTTATTLLALLPILTSTGRGADIMIPMAIPSFGGMLIAVLTMFVVPTLFCMVKERQFRLKEKHKGNKQ